MGKKPAVPALHGHSQASDYAGQNCQSMLGFLVLAVRGAAGLWKVLDCFIPGLDAELFQYFVLVLVEAWCGHDCAQFPTVWPVPLRCGGVDH